MIYVLKMDKKFIERLWEKNYEKELFFKGLRLFFSVETFEFGSRELQLDVTTERRNTTVCGDYISDETLYLLYNEKTEMWFTLEKKEFEIIQNNLNYKTIKLNNFTVGKSYNELVKDIVDCLDDE